MDWLINLFTTTDSVAHIALLYSVVIAIGVYLGKIKIGGISLGVTFVLFAGIVAGHFGFTGPTNILTFVQDFGLILFVFCIGLQVGPGFFESFKKGGVALNLLSTALIMLNIGVMFACYYLFFDTSDPKNLPMMVGTLYGAVTNTPGLGAANEALTSVFANGNVPQIASGYACAYPLGVLGIIGATIAVKYICRVNLENEEEELEEAEAENPHTKAHSMRLKVANSYIAGRTLGEISSFLNRDIVCTRLLHEGKVTTPMRDTILNMNDEVLVVCAEADAEAIKASSVLSKRLNGLNRMRSSLWLAVVLSLPTLLSMVKHSARCTSQAFMVSTLLVSPVRVWTSLQAATTISIMEIRSWLLVLRTT
jgi:putative transport protein